MNDAWAAEAYCQYAATLQWRDPTGDLLPTWDRLTARERWAWMAAVETARELVAHDWQTYVNQLSMN